MQTLISHIEHLLTGNDCVIVPGLGGFVVQHRSALFTEERVLPPHREIYFNKALTHDDGLLISSVSRFRSIDYNSARDLIKNSVRSLEQSLQLHGSVDFGQMGVFSFDENRNVIFEPKESALSRFISFGYSELTLRPLAEIKERETARQAEVKDPDMVYIRISKTKLKRVSAVAAVLLGLWFVSVPVIDKSLTLGSLGFSGKEDVVTLSPVKRVRVKHDTVWVRPEKKSVVRKDTLSTDVVPEQVNQPSSEKYFIVLGTFDSRKRAEAQQKQLIGAGINDVKVMKMGTKMRTYLKGFDNKQDAMNYLNSICDDREEFRQAWLYCVSN